MSISSLFFGAKAATIILGYEYVGKGCCVSSEGNYYDGDWTHATSLDGCAMSCRREYHPTTKFAGINFDPTSYYGCNCMIDLHGNGKINGTETENWFGDTCSDQLCYRYSEVRFAKHIMASKYFLLKR